MYLVLVWSGAIALAWTLLTGLLVEDRDAYAERARDWSRHGTAVRK